MKTPCSNCREREAACHTSCERYLEFRRIKNEELVSRRKRKSADAELSEMSRKRADRIQRYMKRDIRLKNWGR